MDKIPVDTPENQSMPGAGTVTGANGTLGPFYCDFRTTGCTLVVVSAGTAGSSPAFEVSWDGGGVWAPVGVKIYSVLDTGATINDKIIDCSGVPDCFILPADFPIFRLSYVGGDTDTVVSAHIIRP